MDPSWVTDIVSPLSRLGRSPKLKNYEVLGCHDGLKGTIQVDASITIFYPGKAAPLKGWRPGSWTWSDFSKRISFSSGLPDCRRWSHVKLFVKVSRRWWKDIHLDFPALARLRVPPVDDRRVMALASILAVAQTSVENSLQQLINTRTHRLENPENPWVLNGIFTYRLFTKKKSTYHSCW